MLPPVRGVIVTARARWRRPERGNVRLGRYRQLVRRYERHGHHFLAFLTLACTMIGYANSQVRHALHRESAPYLVRLGSSATRGILWRAQRLAMLFPARGAMFAYPDAYIPSARGE